MSGGLTHHSSLFTLHSEGEWRALDGRVLARAFCYILEEVGADGRPRWRGICHLHPSAEIPFGPGRFSLALADGRRVELDARVTIEADSGSIRATFKDVPATVATEATEITET